MEWWQLLLIGILGGGGGWAVLGKLLSRAKEKSEANVDNATAESIRFGSQIKLVETLQGHIEIMDKRMLTYEERLMKSDDARRACMDRIRTLENELARIKSKS